MPRERVLFFIKQYIYDHYKPDNSYHLRKVFNTARYEQAVFTNWAMLEVYRFVDEHPNMEAIYAIEYFAKECDRCALSSNIPYNLFSVAYDVAMDIYDFICCCVEPRR